MSYDSIVLAESNLVAFYKCNETSGTVCTDSKGTNNLTINGTTTINQTGLLADGEPCYKFILGQTGAKSSTNWQGAGQCAMEFWIKPTNFNTSGPFYMAHGSASTDGITITGTVTTGQIQIWNKSSLLATGFNMSAGTLYYVVLNYDGSTTLDMYINTVQQYHNTGVQQMTAVSSGCAIGGYTGANTSCNANGEKFAFYSSPLSGAQMTAHYNAGLGISTGTVIPVQLNGGMREYRGGIRG